MDNSTDNSFDELRQNYQDAVDCVVHCESICQNYESKIETLQEKLASKDEKIATLEEKLVQMSLELALSKAFEDEHRSKRRTLTSSDGSDEVSHPSSKADKMLPGCAKSMDIRVGETVAPNQRETYAGNASGRPSSSGLSHLGQLFRKNHIEGDSKDSVTQESFSAKSSLTSVSSGRQGWTLDDSSSSRLSNFGQLFRTNRSQREAKDCAVQVDFPKVDDEKTEEIGGNDERPQRRPPNRRRRITMQPSSRSILGSCVLFPVTSEDCIGGCVDRSSKTVSQTLSNNQEWPELRQPW